MVCTSCGGGTSSGNGGRGCCQLEAMDEETPHKKIQNGDSEFCFIEITNAICESLQKDEGIHPSSNHKNNDCEDLSALNDLATAKLHNSLMLLNMCDVDAYKCWLDSLVSWQWNIDKATICAICGLWKNIHDLWDEFDRVWKEFTLVWAAINAIISRINVIENDIKNILKRLTTIEGEINKLWNDSSSIWQNLTEISTKIINLQNKDKNLQDQIDNINKNMPSGFSTLFSKVLWQGTAHAGQTFNLSEPLTNFDLIRVKYNVGGSQYSTDLLPGYFAPNNPNVATYSGIDYSGDYEFRAAAGLEGTSADLSSLVMTTNKSTLVYQNLATGKIDQWYKGTSTNNKTGECTISRIEGLRQITFK